MIFTGWCWAERSPETRFSLDFIWLCDRIHNPPWVLSNDEVWSVIFSLSASEEFHLCRELSSSSPSFLSPLRIIWMGYRMRRIRGQFWWPGWGWSEGYFGPPTSTTRAAPSAKDWSIFTATKHCTVPVL